MIKTTFYLYFFIRTASLPNSLSSSSSQKPEAHMSRLQHSHIEVQGLEIPYLHRDISWLDFNYRVLQEAKDARVPLFERINFS